MKMARYGFLAVAFVLLAHGSRGLLAADPEVEELKDQVKVLQGKVSDLEKEKAAKAPAPAGAPAPAPGTAPAAEKPREALNDQSGAAPRPEGAEPAGEEEPGAEEMPKIPAGHPSEVPYRRNYNDEQEAAPRPDDLTLDPKYIGFIPVPRTPVLLKFNAKPRVDMTWDPQNTGDNTRFITAKIPIDQSPPAANDPNFGGGSVFNINAKGSRLSFDVRAPTVPGTPRFYFENDFYGSGSAEFNFRVRHIYGQFYNLIVGQTFSVFEDPDVWPDTVDFEGPNSQLSRRHPQVRYQLPLAKEWNMNFGLEQPGSSPADFVDGAGVTTTVNGANHAPDLAANARWERAGVGHLQFSSVFRDLSDKGFTAAGQTFKDDSTLGWGLNLAGAFQVFKKDSVQAQVTGGKGIGSYGNDTSFFKTDAAIDVHGDLVALPYVGVMLGYTHWWEEHWRSSVSYGFVDMGPEDSQGANGYDTTHYVSANVVWQIRKRLSVGLEGLYGVNRVQDGDNGDAWRVQVGLIYKLFD
jgi:outer membrane DcaP-like protein